MDRLNQAYGAGAMRDRPTFLRVRAAAAYHAAVDLISSVIGAVRTGTPHARRITESGAWGARYPAFVGVGFHVVLGGTGWLVGRGGTTTALRAGDVVLAPFGSEHGLSHAPRPLGALPMAPMNGEPPAAGPSDFDFLCGCYRLDRGRAHEFLRHLPDVVVIPRDEDGQARLRLLTALLDDDVSEDRPGGGASRAALLDLILVHALRRWQERSGEWPAVADPRIAAALHAIHDGPERAWTVQRLSGVAGMSRTAFVRRFTAAVGKPPMAYVTGWRLVCAARLLRETRDPLAAIARRVGYATESAFGGAFRREFGVAPGRFRADMDLAR
ncbi:AraC family transcriptional regulator [Actinoplanes sp. NBRC 14428]|nr:AraC family transcriptional regulator [Actinoplanes sp. NBRC 14428]